MNSAKLRRLYDQGGPDIARQYLALSHEITKEEKALDRKEGRLDAYLFGLGVAGVALFISSLALNSFRAEAIPSRLS